MELAAAFGTSQSGGVIVAAISAVFTMGYVANLLGEDEDWLFELSIDMFPEDGCLWVYGIGEDGVTAFTEYGIECLRQIIADERAAGRAPPQVRPPGRRRLQVLFPTAPCLPSVRFTGHWNQVGRSRVPGGLFTVGAIWSSEPVNPERRKAA